jgi:hypothetical protein
MASGFRRHKRLQGSGRDSARDKPALGLVLQPEQSTPTINASHRKRRIEHLVSRSTAEPHRNYFFIASSQWPDAFQLSASPFEPGHGR